MNRFHRPHRLTLALLGVFAVVKFVHWLCYPNPYLIGDTEQYVLSADSLSANPYKPMGYSLYLAFTRWFSPSPIVPVVLQGLLRGVAVAALVWVATTRVGMSRAVALGLGVVVAFDPQAWFLDHFLLADAVHLAITIGILASALAFRQRPSWPPFIVGVALVCLAVLFRFVGVVYAALFVVLVWTSTEPVRARIGRTLLVAGAVAATVLAMSAHMHQSLGRFRPTTFDGWAFFGNIGPLLDFTSWPADDLDRRETRLVADYLATFPAEMYPSHDSSWHRWNKDAPSKHLLRAFWPRYEMDDVDVRRNTVFMTEFLRFADPPTTPAARHFDAHRNRADPNLPPFALQYWHAFIVVNDLFRGFVRDWLPDHVGTYVRGFFGPSYARVFVPDPRALAHGRYTHREHPDGSIPQFWPGHHTPTWAPRWGDPMAAFRPVYRPWVTVGWLLAVVAIVVGRRRPATRWRDGAWLVAFAAIYGAAVAYSHLVELRYVAPILPWVWTGAALGLTPVRRSDSA